MMMLDNNNGGGGFNEASNNDDDGNDDNDDDRRTMQSERTTASIEAVRKNVPTRTSTMPAREKGTKSAPIEQLMQVHIPKGI